MDDIGRNRARPEGTELVVRPKEKLNPKKKRCPYCDLETSSNKSMQKHIKAKHRANYVSSKSY